MNNIKQKIEKLGKGDSFQKFYYIALGLETSEELAEFIKINRFWYEKSREDIKEQLKEKYKRLRKQEEENG